MAKGHQMTVWLKAVIGTVLILVSLALIAAWIAIAVRLLYKDKVYPGVYVGSINVGGKTKEEARVILEKELEKLKAGITFSYKEKNVVVSLSSVSFDGSLAYQLFSPDVDKTINKIIAQGRQEFFVNNLSKQMSCWTLGCGVDLVVDYNKPKILELLKEQFGSFEAPAHDAELVWEDDGNWRIEGEKFGQRFDYEAIFASFEATLKQVKNEPVRLILEEDAPNIFAAQVAPDLAEQIKTLQDKAPITFKFIDPTPSDSSQAIPPSSKDFGEASKTWIARTAEVKSWIGLSVKYDKNKKVVNANFTDKLLTKYLETKIAPSVNQDPLEPKFALKDGKVEEFQTAREGREIDMITTISDLRKALAASTDVSTEALAKEEGSVEPKESGAKEVNITVKKKVTEFTKEEINSLNIEEVIGTGTSTFAGSPANRRHNIAVGAKALNGLLIKPGEEFSLVKALGEIDASSGYLQELVIKQNKTIPEFGGGLCQIGTTLFRTVLNTGLPVTERRNHSYRVQYYEPAGTDATIYDPWPDFRFINDTQNYILIQTKINGNTAVFQFWGKRDGRTVDPIKPTIYNIVKPPPAKIVETLDLKPGEKKCTEKAHNGADAWFNYKVTYPTGEIKENKFSSHYIPWQEVCLIGVEKLSDPNAPTDGELPLGSPDAVNVVTPTSTNQ
jgi:vancomycin resistance protein YoaR